MSSGVDRVRAQRAEQQVATAKHVLRQVALVVIVAVEELAFLISMQRRVGGIKVQDQPFGWARGRGDELIKHYLVNGHGSLPIGALLEAA